MADPQAGDPEGLPFPRSDEEGDRVAALVALSLIHI